MKKLVAIVVILGLAGAAQAEFSDDFDSNTASNNYVWTPGDTVAGNNGWMQYFDEGAGMNSLDIGSGGSGIGPPVQGTISAAGQRGVARDITADKSGDSYEASVMIGGMDASEQYAILRVGAAGHLTTDHTPESMYILHVAPIDVTLGLRHDGGWYYNYWTDTSLFPFTEVDFADWMGLKIVLDTDYAHAFIADIDSTTGDVIGDWTDLGRFPNVGDKGKAKDLTGPSIIPFIPAEASFQHHADHAGDNFSSVPEPVTLAILALGGGLALLRRRR
jgi:hypothetical protein